VLPETRYARSGDVHIAYQVVGDGPLDLVVVPGHISHLEHQWEAPSAARLLRRLASFSRLILFDKRGTGLSDRVGAVPSLEQRMDDVRAVMDAAGSEQAALLGISEGGSMAMLFAATYPPRTRALVLYGAFAHWREWVLGPEQLEQFLEWTAQSWGTGDSLAALAPDAAEDENFKRWWGRLERLGASPGATLDLLRMNDGIDVRHILPTIRLPTLVIHRVGDPAVKVEAGRYLAEHIAGARYVELPGRDHIPWAGDVDALADEIEEFLTGVRQTAEPDRVLATVLFTDVVGSTERASQLGDRRWKELLEQHHATVRRELERFRGREIDTAGDGFLATFDGPARGIRCAEAITHAVRPLGLQVRAGLHTGECELMGGSISGIAVHIGARVAARANPGEVLVSSTVKDLVAGSGLEFADRGLHRLKGVPGRWRLYAAQAPAVS
jgi:class 3 adenylate cyclase